APSRSMGIPSPEREALTTMVSPCASVVGWSGLDCASAGVAAASASSETKVVLNMGLSPRALGNEGEVLPKRFPRSTGRPTSAWRVRRTPPARTPGPRRVVVAQTEDTVPWPIPGPWQERPCAGRSPGSRVRARYTAFPGAADLPAGAQWLLLPSKEPC